ncbi:MAG: redox-regulated ATPase YchF [candidate division WOR-3 bacterium]|nr:MAG: redox-regulated ATPase YchF [candidate division WOR-3 bacterium]
MKVGIIGLPNIGKSSLFNLLTKANAQVANFPFTTIDRNVGMATIPDERLMKIVEITKSSKVRFASIEFIDIAGLIKNAYKGDGLGNKFLAHIRDVHLIIHLLRCFTNPDIPHTDSDIVPQRDYEIVRTELFLADLEIVERRIERIKKKAECREEMNQLCKMKEDINRGKIPDETVADLPLLLTKPEIIVLNLDEDGKFKNGVDGYRCSVKLEEDILEFEEKEKEELRKDSGLNPRGLSGLIGLCLEKLSMILFYTIKGEEARAWPVKDSTKVVDAAGMIHSDMKEGFIKAEVLNYVDFMKAEGFAQAQHLGLTKIEGKEYIVQDGDIILIKFRA